MLDSMLGYQGLVKVEKPRKLEEWKNSIHHHHHHHHEEWKNNIHHHHDNDEEWKNNIHHHHHHHGEWKNNIHDDDDDDDDDEFAGANFLSLRTGTSTASTSSSSAASEAAGRRVHKDLENNEIDLNYPPIEKDASSNSDTTTTTTTEKEEEEDEESNSNNNNNSNSNRSGCGSGGGGSRRLQQFTTSAQVKNCRAAAAFNSNKLFKQEVYRGVRHRSELNKWVTEIRPTAHKRKIWLGTYKSPEEAARAYDVGIYYTGKKIPLNFPESVKNLPELPQGRSWEELAPFVKKQALTAAKRACGGGAAAAVVQSSELPPTTKLLPKAITIQG